jgi:ribulose-5-phosphate 4-epimerase/fuculose-1-phosphate aldolase
VTDTESFELFCAAARQAAGEGLMRCSSGNLSWRLGDGRVLVSVSRSWLCRLTPNDVAVIRLADGEVLNGTRPSVETRFHLGILRARADVDVVLHFQTPCATTLACTACEDMSFDVVPEVPYYIGPVAVVPYIEPGSAALADAVVAAMQTRQMAVLRNHGMVTVGKTFDEAIQRAVFFELACSILLHGGDRAECLSTEAVASLLSLSGYGGGPKG